jgi:hypothetical protein
LWGGGGLWGPRTPGPVLANYGLEGLRFVKPVYIGDTIQARLTCKQKTAKEDREGQVPQGVVAWDVEVTNQDSEPVAVYTILTLVKRLGGGLAGTTAGEAALAGEAPAAVSSGNGTARTQPGDAPVRVG